LTKTAEIRAKKL